MALQKNKEHVLYNILNAPKKIVPIPLAQLNSLDLLLQSNLIRCFPSTKYSDSVLYLNLNDSFLGGLRKNRRHPVMLDRFETSVCTSSPQMVGLTDPKIEAN